MTVLRRRILNLPADPEESRRAWAAAFAPYLEMATTEFAPAPGTLVLTRHRLGPLDLVEMEAPPQTLRRTPRMAAGQGIDDLLFLFWLEGEGRATWPGGAVAFARLQGVLLDLARPFAIEAGLVRAIGLVLPRVPVADRAPPLAALHGAVLDPASDPLGRLFFTGLLDLADNAADWPDDRVAQAEETMATLAAAALRRLAPRPVLAGRRAVELRLPEDAAA